MIIMEHWISFLFLISIQIVLLIALSLLISKKKLSCRNLVISLIVGVPFGVLFDLFFGEYLMIYSYSLGYDLSFLVVNGFLSFGLMIATILLFDGKKFISFYGYTIFIGLIYEVTNYFFPVWHWTFLDNNLLEYVVVIGFAHTGLSLMMATTLKLLRVAKFNF